jgi:hypothetical protein
MRDIFTESELKRLGKFVIWASRPDNLGHETNPVLLLTGHELFSDYGVQSVWDKPGGAYKAIPIFTTLRALYSKYAERTDPGARPGNTQALTANSQTG